MKFCNETPLLGPFAVMGFVENEWAHREPNLILIKEAYKHTAEDRSSCTVKNARGCYFSKNMESKGALDKTRQILPHVSPIYFLSFF